MINTQTALLIIFVPLALFKVFGFYKKLLYLSSETPLTKVKKQLERIFNLQS